MHKNMPAKDVQITAHCANSKDDCDNYFSVGETFRTVSFSEAQNGADGWIIEHGGGEFLLCSRYPSTSPDHASVVFAIDREQVVNGDSK